MTGYGLAAIGPGVGVGTGFALAEARAMTGGLRVVALVASNALRHGTGAATCTVVRA